MIGTKLAHYEITSHLGSGGMGDVFLALDTRLNRRVAIKLLSTATQDDAFARERFRREALAAAALDHPFICKVHEIGEVEGRLFIVMEYVEGDTLKAASPAPLPMRRVIEIANELAQALEEAHRRGIVHRDLKPANVMVTLQGHVKVMDFGLAKQLPAGAQAKTDSDAGTMLTGAGVRLGTPAYMSPEQVLGSALDPRSDIFSLGVILYELATGAHPFLRPDPSETMAAILRDPPTSGSRDEDDLPGLRVVLHRMLAKACAERHQTMSELRIELEALRDRAWASGSSSHQTLTAAAQPAERTPFVGRDNESAELRRMLDRMLTGQGGFALVGGEPGVGKTRIAREVMKEAHNRGSVVLTGHCYEMEGAPPFVPFIEMLEHSARTLPLAMRTVMGDLAPDIATIAPGLRRILPDIPPGPAIPPEQQRRQIFSAYLEYVQRASQKSPVVALFDDLHWADEPTLQLLLHVAPHLQSMRVLAIGTYRDVELDVKRPFARTLESLLRQRLATRITLRRFTESGVEQMLSAMSGSAAPPGLARAVFRETEGNAFFVEEVYQHLAEEGKLFDESGRWKMNLRVDAIDVPEGVRLVIGRRLDRLGDDARKVLTAGAMIGRSFALDLLEAVVDLGADDVLDALEQAEKAQLISADASQRAARYAFVHELIRTTLVSSLSLPRRQRLHLKIADALEHLRAASLDSHVSVLAHHLYQAGAAADVERTVKFLMQAGRRALAAGAFEDGLEILDNLVSLELPADHQALPEVFELRGSALQGLQRPDDAAAAFERAIERYAARRDDAGVARAAQAEADCYAWRALMSQGIDAITRGLNRLGPAAIAERVALQARLANWQVSQAYVEEAARNIDEALASAEQLGDPALLSRVLITKAIYCRQTNQWKSVIEICRRLQGQFSDMSLWDCTDTLWTLALAFLVTGRFALAETILPELEASASRAGHHGALWAHERVLHAIEYARTGDIQTFLTHTEHNMQRASQFPFLTESQAAALILYQGRIDEAIDRLLHAMAGKPPGSSFDGLLEGNMFAALAFAGRTGQAQQAYASVEPFLPKSGRPNVVGAWQALGTTVLALAHTGERKKCAALYPMALEWVATGLTCEAHPVGPVSPQLAAAITAHAAGLDDQARQHFEAARREARETPYRTLQPAVDYWQGRTLVENIGRPESAAGLAMVEHALTDFRGLGMVLHANLAEEFLRQAQAPLS